MMRKNDELASAVVFSMPSGLFRAWLKLNKQAHVAPSTLSSIAATVAKRGPKT
jgi:hypothetical protein